MKLAIIALILLAPAASLATEHVVRRGESSRIPVKLDYMKETMIVLPESAVSVTGAGAPAFQVEPAPDYVMLRALTPTARGNLFVNLGGKTIVSLKLSTVQSGGDQLITLKYQAPGVKQNALGPGTPGASANVGALAGPWKVKKLRSKSNNAGFAAYATYALESADRIYVNFRIKNNTDRTLNVSNVTLVRNTLGGLKGSSVADSVEIPSESALEIRSLSPGEDAYGTVVFPKIYVDFDQTLVLRVHNAMAEGPELRIAL